MASERQSRFTQLCCVVGECVGKSFVGVLMKMV